MLWERGLCCSFVHCSVLLFCNIWLPFCTVLYTVHKLSQHSVKYFTLLLWKYFFAVLLERQYHTSAVSYVSVYPYISHVFDRQHVRARAECYMYRVFGANSDLGDPDQSPSYCPYIQQIMVSCFRYQAAPALPRRLGHSHPFPAPGGGGRGLTTRGVAATKSLRFPGETKEPTATQGSKGYMEDRQ
jgi:hypothetical protein